MTGWRALCPRSSEGCTWLIDSLTESAARTAVNRHWRESHWSPPERKPPHVMWPYRGRPNKTLYRLLRLAAAGQLYARVDAVYYMDPRDGPPHISWMPAPLQREIQKWVPGLVTAGLLREPKEPPGQVKPGDDKRLYRVTPEGHRALSQVRA